MPCEESTALQKRMQTTERKKRRRHHDNCVTWPFTYPAASVCRFQHENRANVINVLTSAFFTEASLSIPRGDHCLSFALVSTIICVVWCGFVCGDSCQSGMSNCTCNHFIYSLIFHRAKTGKSRLKLVGTSIASTRTLRRNVRI